MKRFVIFFVSLFAVSLGMISCNDTTAPAAATTTKQDSVVIKEENITYTDHGDTLNGFVAYDGSNDRKRPAVLIVHEWWGLNDYSRFRARELAKLGYVALALDMFGHGKVADNPDSALKFAMPFYKNPAAAKSRIEAALQQVKALPVTDTNNIAAIGYCFGGSMVLNVARLGTHLKGVASFHGELTEIPTTKDLLKAKILVCNGEADSFVKAASIDRFKKQMDALRADYAFKNYPGAIHSFTNPGSTATGKKFNLAIAYQPAADTASWKDLQDFFNRTLK